MYTYLTGDDVLQHLDNSSPWNYKVLSAFCFEILSFKVFALSFIQT